MKSRVLVLGWSIRACHYYVRLLRQRGDERNFTVHSMRSEHVRGLDPAAWSVVILRP